jgi:CBS domain-containing protein
MNPPTHDREQPAPEWIDEEQPLRAGDPDRGPAALLDDQDLEDGYASGTIDVTNRRLDLDDEAALDDYSGETVGMLMTPNPVALPVSSSVLDAARLMRDEQIGDVLVVDDGGELTGILTDRDLVIRVLAAETDPLDVTVGEVCSSELHALDPDAPVEDAIDLVRTHHVRRIPVVRDGVPVGIITIGDLAIERDPESALADISQAPANE